jgi:membrane associated rhomboid family serine protease/Zn-finger nucleic acid-binding protein
MTHPTAPSAPAFPRPRVMSYRGTVQHHGFSERRCPRCTYPLSVFQDRGLHIDHCYRCGGSFLDPGETGAAFGTLADPTTWKREMLTRPAMLGHLPCPAGHAPMWVFDVAWGSESVEVDACGICHGLWVDAWEAPKLHTIATEAHAEITAENKRPGAIVYLIQLATMVPVEVYNPVRRKPILVHGLLVLLSLIYALELALMVSAPGAAEAMVQTFAMVPAAVTRGPGVLGLFTHAFLHGSIPHLIGNLYFLWIFGDNVEDALGRKRFIVLYAASALAGGLAHLVGNLGSQEAMLGASGAISGLMGAYLVLFPRVKVWIVFLFIPFKMRAVWYLLIWVGLQFLLVLDPENQVAWLAHVGGFAAGALLALLLRTPDKSLGLLRPHT